MTGRLTGMMVAKWSAARLLVEKVHFDGHESLITARISGGFRSHWFNRGGNAGLCSRNDLKQAAPVLLQARLARLYLDRLEKAGFNAFDPAINAVVPLKAWSLWWGRFAGRV